MKKFDCQCCGAALPIPERYQRYIKCPYCDATYEIENYEKYLTENYAALPEEVKYVIVQTGHIQKLRAKVHFDDYEIRTYPPEIIEKQARHRLAEEIMEYLKKQLNIREDINIFELGRTYSTTIYLDIKSFE